jgi:DNA-binding CsgD family transcriptional regulator
MKNISDLQIGKAGEYLVCADLITQGFVAYPSEQGLPYDLILDVGERLLKVQVKTTREPKEIPQRKTSIPAYIFHIGNNGKNNRRKKYDSNDVDLFALVSLDTKRIAYLHYLDCKTTMNFRVPELRGKYHDEQGIKIKEDVQKLRRQGYTCKQIAGLRQMSLSNVYKYSSNVSIEQKGTNSGVYFDEFDLKKCLKNWTWNTKI